MRFYSALVGWMDMDIKPGFFALISKARTTTLADAVRCHGVDIIRAVLQYKGVPGQRWHAILLFVSTQ
jgi:hypothetical protein